MPAPPSRTAGLVRCRNVTKTYGRGRRTVHALRSVTLTIPDGEFIGVVGPSGSGKTTLLHLLAALDTPTRGSIEVDTWVLPSLEASERTRYRRSMVGLVFQEFHLVPTLTALENVALPLLLAGEAPASRKARAEDVLTLVGLADRMGHRPAELSGGEQQRVATARALVGDPPLLLADEPTGNLDATTSAQVAALLARLHQEHGRTVVVATHHLEDIEPYTDRVFHLQDGALTAPAPG